MAYDFAAALDDLLRPRPGWVGNYTTTRAPGAMPSGTRFVKVAEEAGDAHPLGHGGVVLGSICHPERGICYFVEWDGAPKTAVAVIAWKIRGP